MLGRRFDLDLSGARPDDVERRAAPYRGGRWRGTWIRVDGDRLTARVLSSGRLMADGVLRAQVRTAPDGCSLHGRIRWGNVTAIVVVYLTTGFVVLAMGIGYGRGEIMLVAAVPFAMAGFWYHSSARGRDDEVERLRSTLVRTLGGPRHTLSQEPS